MATVVSDEARPEIISRGHVSSNRSMLASIRWSPTAAKTQAVTTTRTPVIRASRPGVAKNLSVRKLLYIPTVVDDGNGVGATPGQVVTWLRGLSPVRAETIRGRPPVP